MGLSLGCVAQWHLRVLRDIIAPIAWKGAFVHPLRDGTGTCLPWSFCERVGIARGACLWPPSACFGVLAWPSAAACVAGAHLWGVVARGLVSRVFCAEAGSVCVVISYARSACRWPPSACLARARFAQAFLLPNDFVATLIRGALSLYGGGRVGSEFLHYSFSIYTNGTPETGEQGQW